MKKLFIKNIAGVSLAMVLIVMTILTALGLGVISTSLGNLSISDTIADSEKAYYSAEDAAQIAIATIKDEVSYYYSVMRKSENYATYLLMYNNFFNYLEERLAGEGSILQEPNFISDQLDDDISIICTMEEPTTQTSGYLGATFEITCASIVDASPRIIKASIEVEAAPIDFQYTTAPIHSDDMLILGGNVAIDKESNENSMIVYGTARIGGDILDTDAFSTTGSASINDYSVEDDLTWKLYYDQFDTSVIDPVMPPVINLSGGIAQYLVSNNYDFFEDTTIVSNVVTKNIYCDGDITFLNVDVINSNVYATGNITIIDEDSAFRNYEIYGTNIYAGGDLYVEVADIINNLNNRRLYYAGGDMILKIGKQVDKKDGSIAYGSFTAGGNIFISSLTENDNDSIVESQFLANGNITTGTPGGPVDPTIENIATSTFETINGDITLHTAYMHSSSKVHSGRNVILANKGVSDSEVYADGWMHFDGSSFYNFDDDAYVSNNVKYCAQGDLTIEHANFDNCYFYTGNDLRITMTSGNSIVDSIMYAEHDVIYSNDWFGFMDTMVNTLVYNNGDFYFSGRGIDLSFLGPSFTKPAGMQIMSLGNIYSYEEDDDDTSGYWGLFSNSELDVLKFGDYGTSDFMDVSVIKNNIGYPDEALGILAGSLHDAGFEHYLEEPIIKLPLYTEVFKNETITEN
ncbi:MAG: pilus assembly PilX N-terminal domain-containing protein [Clostridiales bacterium]|nr:pilus assembly PilX N-terminal domain-containing protein [Clostridiales bacterium]